MRQGHPVERLIQNVHDARQVIDVESGIGIREQRAGVPVAAHAKHDEIELGALTFSQPEDFTDRLLVGVRGIIDVIVLGGNPMYVLCWNSDLAQECLGRQPVIAVLRVGRNVTLVHPEELYFVPRQGSRLRHGREQLKEPSRRMPAGERRVERAMGSDRLTGRGDKQADGSARQILRVGSNLHTRLVLCGRFHDSPPQVIHCPHSARSAGPVHRTAVRSGVGVAHRRPCLTHS